MAGLAYCGWYHPGLVIMDAMSEKKKVMKIIRLLREWKVTQLEANIRTLTFADEAQMIPLKTR